MRCRIALVLLSVLWLLISAKAQQTASNRICETQSDTSRPSLRTTDDQPRGPEISIAEVAFSGSLELPVSEQQLIADSIKEKTHGNAMEEVTDEALERARAGWLNHGYFKAQVTGEARTLSSSPASQSIGLSVHVEEGQQYRLNSITFKNNKAMRTEVLRAYFPIEHGDVFSREKIAKGLEDLRNSYDELGYLNFTAVPDTQFNDQERLITLVIEVDEGKQFHLRNLNLFGLDEAFRQELLQAFPIGQIYSERRFQEFLENHSSSVKFSPDDPSYRSRKLDERRATVGITLDARPCGSD